MYQLYFSPGAASLAVHWALLEIGAPHELVAVDLAAGEQRSAAYLALHPGGVVPTLIVDGEPAQECVALLLLLAERHPGWAPAPGAPGRARFLSQIALLANTLQPAFRLYFHPAELAGDDAADRVRAGAIPLIAAVWDRLARDLEQQAYLAGDAVTVADFYATMLMRWSRNHPRPATAWPAIAAYVARMKARPSFATLYAREGLTEWA